MAPPRLRIRLKRPLASATRSGGKWPSASRVGGSRQNMMAEPRRICGSSISSKSVSQVWKALSPSPTANSEKPPSISIRPSTRRSSATAIGAVTSWAMPVTSMMWPISSGPCSRTKARNTGIR